LAIITAIAVGAAVVGTVMASRASAAAGSRAEAGAAQSAGAERNARETNARRRERLAADVLDRGRKSADIILGRSLEIRAAQRAGFAASGVLISSGSTQIVESDTLRLAQADAVVTMFDAIAQEAEIKSAGAFDDLASLSRERAAITQGQTAAAGFRAQGTAALIGGVSSVAGTLNQAGVFDRTGSVGTASRVS
jgi:hypothetical protein